MTSKAFALKVLDGMVGAVLGTLILSTAGFPTPWLAGLLDISAREFPGFSLFIVFAALWLMHEIGTSDSARDWRSVDSRQVAGSGPMK
jgi:hypothetical protein